MQTKGGAYFKFLPKSSHKCTFEGSFDSGPEFLLKGQDPMGMHVVHGVRKVTLFLFRVDVDFGNASPPS
jgi:hypothetical protein